MNEITGIQTRTAFKIPRNVIIKTFTHDSPVYRLDGDLVNI